MRIIFLKALDKPFRKCYILFMIRTRDIQIISDMLKLAKKNKKPKRYSMVAFLVDDKKVVSVGFNDYVKTHPSTPQIEDYIIPTHSETKCIARYLVKHRSIKNTMTLYVAGMTAGRKDNLCCSSKPCESCAKFIKSVGIPRVVYFEKTDENSFKILEEIA